MKNTHAAASSRPEAARPFLIGESVSLAGSQLGLYTIPLIAVELLHATTFQLGLLTTIEYIPFVALALFFGAIVDQVQPRTTLLLTNSVRLVLLATLSALVLTSSLNYITLILVVVLLSTAGTLFDLSLQSAVPLVATSDYLGRVNGRFEIVRSSGQTFAPPLVGFVYGLGGAWLSLLMNAATYVAGLWGSRTVPRAERGDFSDRPTFRSLLASIGEGLRYIGRDRPDLVAVITAATVSNIASGALTALQSAYMLRDLGLSTFLLGITVAIAGLTGLGGAILGGRLADRLGHRTVMLTGLLISAVSIILLIVPVAAWHQFAITSYLGICLGLVAAGNTMFNIAMVSYRQSTVPQQLLGRANSAARAAIMSGVPLGALIGGVLATAWGLRPTFLVLALVAAGGVAAIAVATRQHAAKSEKASDATDA